MARTWRIGEVAERTGLTRRTLRHYDELGLLVPSARSWGDYRLYDEADLLRLLQIQNLKALGLSLAEIAEALNDPELDAGATLRTHLAQLEQQIAAEQALAVRLHGLAEADDRSWEDVLAAIAAARRLAHPDPAVRLRTALGAEGSTAELLAALTTETSPAVQEVLVWSLAQRPDATAAALDALAGAGPDQRCVLVRLLGKTGEAASVPALVGLLDDPEPRVVATAVRALAALGAPVAADALVDLLGSPVVDEADLLDAIEASGGAALEPLVIATSNVAPHVRSAAADALGRVSASRAPAGQRRALAVLDGLLADADASVRLSALLALGSLGTDARPSVESALTDPTLAAVARRLLDLPAT